MRRHLRCPGAICCPARRALRAVLQPHPVLRRADRRRVEPTASRMRRLSPPAGCGGCFVGGKPRGCLQDSVNRGTRVRHHPRPRPTARSRFSSRSDSEWTVGAAPARSRCPPGLPWPGLARGRAAERASVKAHFFGSFARAWGGPLRPRDTKCRVWGKCCPRRHARVQFRHRPCHI